MQAKAPFQYGANLEAKMDNGALFKNRARQTNLSTCFRNNFKLEVTRAICLDLCESRAGPVG